MNSNRLTAGTIVLLVGDILMFLIFSFAGRADHGMSLTWTDTLKTAIPFILGWLVTAPLMGAYKPESVKSVATAAKKTAATITIATIVGLIFRSIYLQRNVDLLFAGITLGFNLFVFIAWRVIYTWLKNRIASKA